MKNLTFLKTLFALSVTGLLVSQCVHEDQEIPTPTPPDENKTELKSTKTTTPPVIDGVIDDSWQGLTTLDAFPVVPDPKGSDGTSAFAGYVGDTYAVSLRSMYDDQNIYFLAEWTDQNEDLNRQTWYFDPSSSRWAQESRYPTFNSDDVMIRGPFYEDKFAFLWNVNNTVNAWDQSTCWTSCHSGLSPQDGLARHYTNSATEKIDMWHWKSVRTGLPIFQSDDQYQDNDTPNGRHSDPKDGGGYSNNKQTLTITGTTEDVSVPLYVIPDRTYYYWIIQDEIDNGTAKTITAVDQNGVLTYSGGTIDPNVDTDYLRQGITTGPKGIPSIYTDTILGNRGDITAGAVYTGSGWILELKRALKTGDIENVDIDFSSLEDEPFGIGVFDNSAIAHAITANLILKFEK